MEIDKNKPYRLESIKNFIPQKVGFWLYYAFATVFFLSGGMYLGLVNNIVGTRNYIREDVMFGGYAFFVGITLVFPILFRLKFRFTNKSLLLVVTLCLIACNIITMKTNSLPLFIVASFFAGGFRMIGIFECFSTIQLKITPTRDFAKFFPAIYVLVLGSIELSGIISKYFAWFYSWEFMNTIAIGMLSVVAICVIFFLRPHKINGPMPFKGIDWLGLLLWSVFLMLVIFVLEYGEYYDWFESKNIYIATVAALILGLINYLRNKNPHSYINIKAILNHRTLIILLLFAAMSILLATSNILENTYTGAILHFDVLNSISLNYMALLAVIVGCVFSYFSVAKWSLRYKILMGIGFSLIVLYEITMYFLIAPVINKEMLYIPVFFRSLGKTILFVTLTIYLARTVPFIAFFQVLTILGIVRTCWGTPLGTAIVGRSFSVLTKSEIQNLSTEIDYQNTFIHKIPFENIINELHRQALMVSIKEIYGYAAIAGVLILILAVATRYNRILKFRMPRW